MIPATCGVSASGPLENSGRTGRQGDVPLLFPHLLKRVCQIKCTNLLGILEFQKLVPAVACHIHKDVATVIRQQPLAPGCLLADAIRQQPYEVFDRDLVSSVVHLDVVAVQIHSAVGVGVDGAREGVARVAGHVVGQHEDDLGVRDAEALHGAVDGQHVGQVAVVEPEPRGADQHGPVAGVLAESMAEEEEARQEDGQAEERREVHRGGAVSVSG